VGKGTIVGIDRKAAWYENIQKVKANYPSLNDADWGRSNQDAFTHVMGDLLKSEGKRSRPGKRPALDRSIAEGELAKLTGSSYSETDFRNAFKALTHGRSIRGIAHKCGMHKDQVHRLLNGTVQPSLETMEKIAKAFRKDPSYFVEYRVAFVLISIDKYLSDSPETATVWYHKMKGL